MFNKCNKPPLHKFKLLCYSFCSVRSSCEQPARNQSRRARPPPALGPLGAGPRCPPPGSGGHVRGGRAAVAAGPRGADSRSLERRSGARARRFVWGRSRRLPGGAAARACPGGFGHAEERRDRAGGGARRPGREGGGDGSRSGGARAACAPAEARSGPGRAAAVTSRR